MKRVCWGGEPSRLACIALLAGILAVTAQPWNDDAPGTRLVQSALQLRDALADATVAEVLVNTSIVINGTAWRPVEVTRSLTVRATRALLKANRYAVVDFGTTVRKPGTCSHLSTRFGTKPTHGHTLRAVQTPTFPDAVLLSLQPDPRSHGPLSQPCNQCPAPPVQVMLFSLGSGNVLTWIGIDVSTGSRAWMHKCLSVHGSDR